MRQGGISQALLGRIAKLELDMEILSSENLEASCKKSVDRAVMRISNMLGKSDETDKLSRLEGTLWALFPDHQDWPQWRQFMEIHHLAVSDNGVRLSIAGRPNVVDEKGRRLSVAEIAANHTSVFPIVFDSPGNFGWPKYVSVQKDPSMVFAFVPTALGLYDMIGNVWEWCTNEEAGSGPVICGGSCLSSVEFVSPQAIYEFNKQACDVGFRVVMPVK